MPRNRRQNRRRKQGRRRLQPKINPANTLLGQLLGASGMSNVYRNGNYYYNILKNAKAKLPVKRKTRRGRAIRKKDDDPGTGGYTQWTQRYAQARFGSLTPRKIDRLSTDKVIYTHRNIGPFDNNGKLFLSNSVDANGTVTYPLVLFELNSCNNFINGTQTFHDPVKQLYQTNTNSVGWFSRTGQSTDGTNVTNWILERSPHKDTTSMSHPGENAIHLWSSVDLECWGCKNKPTKFMIQLVQFSEDVLPDYGAYTGNVAEFWQSMVKHYTYNPLAKMENSWGTKKYKVLRQYTFNIDPTASYENDADPHVKTMKLFYRFNRRCNFQWKMANASGLTVAGMDAPNWQQEDAENQTQVHPNARLYVMIRAANFTRLAAGATIDNTTNPSISWRMRTAYMINQ